MSLLPRESVSRLERFDIPSLLIIAALACICCATGTAAVQMIAQNPEGINRFFNALQNVISSLPMGR